jgi:hypothetical protein
MHKRFQELSALAATGQITREDRSLLDRHTIECDECRAFLNDLALLKARVAPVVAGSCAQSLEPPAQIRERFLLRAAARGLDLKAGPVLARPESFTAAAAPAPGIGGFPIEVGRRLRLLGSGAIRFAPSAAACLLCALLGYVTAQRRPGEVAPPAMAAHPVPIPWQIPVPPLVRTPSLEQAALTDRIEKLVESSERERAESQRRLESLSADLLRAQAESARLTRDLAAASDRASASARFEQQFKAEALRVQNAEDRIRQLQADLSNEHDRRRRLELAALLPPSGSQANARITDLEAQLERERQMKADPDEFTQLVAARNLHIVDVYDTASNGHRQRPFGRVFYVEGRSLVFYAYDLADEPRATAKVTFHVWGEKASLKSTTYNLGILKGDGEGQSRWVLTFDDPKVLNRINAVYVTAEAGVEGARGPRGRRILYAFLGSANHP